MSPDDAALRLGPYGQHWLVTFAASKYAPARQVIKETNLFFALPALLALFPGSPAAVLTRSPLGVASSFARGDLFRRWDYRSRYRQMTAMTTRPEFAARGGLVPDDDPSGPGRPGPAPGLNTLLLAAALHSRGSARAHQVRDGGSRPGCALAARHWSRLVPEAPGLRPPRADPLRPQRPRTRSRPPPARQN